MAKWLILFFPKSQTHYTGCCVNWYSRSTSFFMTTRIEIVAILVHYQPSYNTSHTMKPSDPLLLAYVTLRCGMYPAGPALAGAILISVKTQKLRIFFTCRKYFPKPEKKINPVFHTVSYKNSFTQCPRTDLSKRFRNFFLLYNT